MNINSVTSIEEKEAEGHRGCRRGAGLVRPRTAPASRKTCSA